ncbi:hypothetical protein NL676_004499 [Syzygium grande]|nr:hypothetical protein NL676_004499 [Syzygium grande]
MFAERDRVLTFWEEKSFQVKRRKRSIEALLGSRLIARGGHGLFRQGQSGGRIMYGAVTLLGRRPDGRSGAPSAMAMSLGGGEGSTSSGQYGLATSDWMKYLCFSDVYLLAGNLLVFRPHFFG